MSSKKIPEYIAVRMALALGLGSALICFPGLTASAEETAATEEASVSEEDSAATLEDSSATISEDSSATTEELPPATEESSDPVSYTVTYNSRTGEYHTSSTAYITCYYTIDQASGTATITSYSMDSRYISSGQTVTIPSSVTDTGNNSYTVTTIGDSAFNSQNLLAGVVIPDTVTSIGTQTFYNCYNLTSLTLSDSLETIGASAFQGCSKLASLTLPANLKSLGKDAFAECNALTEVSIPASVTSAKKPFEDCKSLTTITFQEGTTTLPEGICEGLTALTTVVMEDSVTAIGDSAFYGCTGLTDFTFPSNLKTIGSNAFNGSGLKSVSFPENVSRIGSGAFQNCPLTSITFPENAEITLDSSCFYNCDLLSELRIPSGIVCSTNAAPFASCDRLTKVTFGAGTTKISDHICASMTSLTDVVYEDASSITEIGRGAFSGCTSLAAFTIPANVATMDANAFYNCRFTEISLPANVSAIGDYAFAVNANLAVVNFPEGLTSIGAHAFEKDSALSSAALPDSLTSLGENCFTGTGLTEITLPKSLSSADGAFESTGISKITFQAGTSLIPAGVSSGMSSLTSIVFEDPDAITEIGESAFSSCTSLAAVTIPGSVTAIGSSAFNGCTSLTDIAIPDSVTTIGSCAFSGCSALQSVKMGKGITALPDGMFNGCYYLTRLVIPSGVVSIGSNVFSQNGKVLTVSIPSSVTEIDSAAIDTNTTVYICGEKGSCAETFAATNSLYNFVETASTAAITISSPSKVLPIGRKARLSVEFAPAGSLDTLTWTSSDSSIADVNAFGVVTGRRTGEVTITALTDSTGIKDSIRLTVTQGSTTEDESDGVSVLSGSSYSDLGETYRGVSITLSDNIDLNVYVSLREDLYGDSFDPCIIFTFGDGHRYWSYVSKAIKEEEDTLYVFRCPVPAKNIGDSITAQLVYSLPNATSNKKFTTSVKDYLETIYQQKDTSAEYEKAAPVAAALLNYGACAQTYFAYDTDDLANAELDETARDVSSASPDLSSYGKNGNPAGGDETLTYMGTGLNLNSSTGLTVSFKAKNSSTDLSSMTFTDESDGETKSCSGSVSGGVLTVSIPGISILDLGETHTLTASDGYIVTVNPLAYINTALSKTADEALQNLLKSLYLYYDAAVAYQNS